MLHVPDPIRALVSSSRPWGRPQLVRRTKRIALRHSSYSILRSIHPHEFARGAHRTTRGAKMKRHETFIACFPFCFVCRLELLGTIYENSQLRFGSSRVERACILCMGHLSLYNPIATDEPSLPTLSLTMPTIFVALSRSRLRSCFASVVAPLQHHKLATRTRPMRVCSQLPMRVAYRCSRNPRPFTRRTLPT